MSATSPDLVRQAVTARILELVVDTSQLSSTTAGYAHATTDTWREAEEPLIPEMEPSTRAHLAFFVDDRDVNDTRTTRSSRADQPVAVAPLVVRFLARMRSGANRKADWDRAARAARALLAHLLTESSSSESYLLQAPASGQIVRRIPIAGTEGVSDFLAVEVRVDCFFQFSLAS